jgi:hypothetical protein
VPWKNPPRANVLSVTRLGVARRQRGIEEKRLPGSTRRFSWGNLCVAAPNAERIRLAVCSSSRFATDQAIVRGRRTPNAVAPDAILEPMCVAGGRPSSVGDTPTIAVKSLIMCA